MDEEIPDPQVSLPFQDPRPHVEASVSNSIDPRWPYLGKWSAAPLPGSASGAVKKDQLSVQTEVEDKASSPASETRQSLYSCASDDDSTSVLPGSTTEPCEIPIEMTFEGVNMEAEVGGFDTSMVIPHQLEDGDHQTAVPSLIISSEPPTATFVPSIGAWAKPLAFEPSTTPPTPSTPIGFNPQVLNNLLDSFWPTLGDGIEKTQKTKQHPTIAREISHMPVQKIPVPELKNDGTLRFPWAARMDPTARNLFRAAKPTFRLDGTPEVTIPSQVLRLGPENKREYIIGHFHRCSLPPGGLIHAVVNRLWGRTCRIGCRKLNDSSYMFHIPHDSTR